MPDDTSQEMKDMQSVIVQRMNDFSAENPTIVEALTVMNMTMPDYFQAMDAIRGGQIASVSSYAPLPVEVSS